MAKCILKSTFCIMKLLSSEQCTFMRQIEDGRFTQMCIKPFAIHIHDKANT